MNRPRRGQTVVRAGIAHGRAPFRARLAPGMLCLVLLPSACGLLGEGGSGGRGRQAGETVAPTGGSGETEEEEGTTNNVDLGTGVAFLMTTEGGPSSDMGVKITHVGSAPAADVKLVLDRDDVASVLPSQGSCRSDGGSFVCTLGTLQPGQSASLTLRTATSPVPDRVTAVRLGAVVSGRAREVEVKQRLLLPSGLRTVPVPLRSLPATPTP